MSTSILLKPVQKQSIQYWLMKSEPSTFSIEDLSNRPEQKEWWDGVRNYEARRYLNEMQVGDLAFLYHSSCAMPGIVGVMRITHTAKPDHTALDATSPYFDAKSTFEHPRWVAVEVQLVTQYAKPILLSTLKNMAQLQSMRLLKRGNRLSVMPVHPEEWDKISALV